MLAVSNTKFPRVDVGTNVRLSIVNVDRERIGPRSVLGPMLRVNNSADRAPKKGLLDRMYARNEFSLADSNFTNCSDVPCVLSCRHPEVNKT